MPWISTPTRRVCEGSRKPPYRHPKHGIPMCAGCSNSYAIRKDGTVRLHWFWDSV